MCEGLNSSLEESKASNELSVLHKLVACMSTTTWHPWSHLEACPVLSEVRSQINAKRQDWQ